MEQEKISVITVVYNDVAGIRMTIESCLEQNWPAIEYIVVDGKSTDGTLDIIHQYQDRIAVVCSEPDDGIYDAMNKGIAMATGQWICFLNSGDCFVTKDSLEAAMTQVAGGRDNADIIYGNSKEIQKEWIRDIYASADVGLMRKFPIYRHGSSLVRASVQKQHPFDIEKASQLSYALDWEMIHRLYVEGYRFSKTDVFIEAYQIEGTSNHPFRNLWWNYKVTSRGRLSISCLYTLAKLSAIELVKRSCLYRWFKAFAIEYIPNDILPHIPFWTLRRFYLRCIGLKTGKGTFVMKKVYWQNPNNVTIGTYSHINHDCMIDARGGITIGNSVSISHKVNLVTGSHDVQTPNFVGIFRPIKIDDYAWVGIGATVLQGVHIGRGAVVCAGAVVNRDVADYEIVGGVPAHPIGKRRKDLDYQCRWNVPLT